MNPKMKLKDIRDKAKNERELELEFWWLFKPANLVYKYYWPIVILIDLTALVLLYLSVKYPV